MPGNNGYQRFRLYFLQGAAQLGGRLVARLGPRLQCALEDGVEARIAADLYTGHLPAATRQLAGEHLVERHAHGIDVRTSVKLRVRYPRFRREKIRRADGDAGPREAQQRDVIVLGQAEVGDLHRAVAREQQVGRLDVAVDDAMLVRVVQRIADLGQYPGGEFRRELALARNHSRQIRAVHEFHHDVEESTRFARLEHAHDARVRELRHRQCLLPEARGEAGIDVLHQLRWENLDCDGPVQGKLDGLEYRAHPALPNEFVELISRQQRLQFGSRRRRPEAAGAGIGTHGRTAMVNASKRSEASTFERLNTSNGAVLLVATKEPELV